EGEVEKIFRDSRGNIWMAYPGRGFLKFDERNFRTSFYNPTSPSDSLLGDNEVKDFLEDNTENLWLATNRGLQYFDTKTGRFTKTYLHEEGNPFSLARNNIRQLLLYNDSTIIISTDINGISIFNTSQKKFRNISSREGLPSSICGPMN